MRQRVISVPINQEALNALDFNTASEEQLIEIEISEKEFSMLFQSGILDLINNTAQVDLEDFEDDSITNRESILSVINTLKAHYSPEEQPKVIKNILAQFQEAYDRRTGIFFFF